MHLPRSRVAYEHEVSVSYTTSPIGIFLSRLKIYIHTPRVIESQSNFFLISSVKVVAFLEVLKLFKMSEPAPVLVAHPALSCVFQGISKSFFNTGGTDVWQFRGIEYGTIPARFEQAVLNEHFPSTFNATLYRYCFSTLLETMTNSRRQKCPQVVTGTRLEEVLIGTPPGKVPENMPDLFDEYHCLNLNISTPPGAREGNDFPVLVYIHGGGGTSGSNSDWWCDPSGLVGKSITMEKPVVAVAIKFVPCEAVSAIADFYSYRLSVFGNLGSEEMRKVNGEQNGGNFGKSTETS